MKNRKITRKITQGMYALTTIGGGCIVDAVSQVSGGEEPIISVAVMKDNFTNHLIKETHRFALSVLGMNVNPEVISVFGFHSMRDYDKFKDVSVEEIDGIPVLTSSLGYMICEVIDTIENETHTLFLGRLVEADLKEDSEAMSYQYYQEHKNELVKVSTTNGLTAWVCSVCGYVYYGDVLPDDFICPICQVDKTYFQKK